MLPLPTVRNNHQEITVAPERQCSYSCNLCSEEVIYLTDHHSQLIAPNSPWHDPDGPTEQRLHYHRLCWRVNLLIDAVGVFMGRCRHLEAPYLLVLQAVDHVLRLVEWLNILPWPLLVRIERPEAEPGA